MTPERYNRLKSVLEKRQPDLTIITDHVHKGRNLSAIVRTADAVGIPVVHSIMEDADYRAFRGTAKGSHRWVEVKRHTNIEEIVTLVKSDGMQIIAADVGGHAKHFKSIDFTIPTALVLGAEKSGLSDETRNYVDHFVTIPMAGMVESFNVSTAAGILLTEAQCQRLDKGMYKSCRLPKGEYDRLFFEWAHSEIANFCQKHGFSYPPLRDDGEIQDLSDWYSVKQAQLKNGTSR